MNRPIRFIALAAALASTALVATSLVPSGMGPTEASAQASGETEIAIYAGGCFWCVEKDFDHVAGVLETTSGYIGGATDNPTYRSHGPDGHLEAVQVVYDPTVINYEDLTHIFLRTIDVTDDGGQFCDRGNSYRTAIFALDDDQRIIAETEIAEGEDVLGRSIVTRVIDASTFWDAEGFHQDYYQKNPLRYNFYRTSCGRDRTVRQVWGEEAYTGVDKSS